MFLSRSQVDTAEGRPRLADLRSVLTTPATTNQSPDNQSVVELRRMWGGTGLQIRLCSKALDQKIRLPGGVHRLFQDSARGS